MASKRFHLNYFLHELDKLMFHWVQLIRGLLHHCLFRFLDQGKLYYLHFLFLDQIFFLHELMNYFLLELMYLFDSILQMVDSRPKVFVLNTRLVSHSLRVHPFNSLIYRTSDREDIIALSLLIFQKTYSLSI